MVNLASKISEYQKASKNYATWPDMYLELRKISEEYRNLARYAGEILKTTLRRSRRAVNSVELVTE